MALQLRRKTHESIVYIDKDSAPRIMPFGEDFILEDIPIGTRVIYPNPSIKGLPNREAAIRYAINHPLEMEPLYALLGVEPNPIPVKWCLSLLGFGAAGLRLPLLELSAAHRAEAATVLAGLGLG